MTRSHAIGVTCKNLWKVFGDGGGRLQRGLADATGVEQLAAELAAQGSIVGCRDIDLKIEPGEFFVLMGLSGSGKSTLMRCLSRLTEPSAGELLLGEQDFLAVNGKQLMQIRRNKIGMVFQHFGLFPHMTVLENIAYPLRVQGVSAAQQLEQVGGLIELVGLTGREQSYPHQLSGGQKQRVGIARSLAVDPELWFLDEPFSALDPMIRWQMQSELLRLQKMFHKTIVFVTHDFMEAVRLADRIAIMKDGAIVQLGSPQSIVLNPADAYVAEFVKQAPRTKILKVAQLMQAQPPANADTEAGGSIAADANLEAALARSVGYGKVMTVTDAAGDTVGYLDPTRIAAVLES